MKFVYVQQKLLWGSNYDIKLMREKLCGDWQWTLNMVFGGVGYALMEFMDHMRLISGNSLGGVGRSVLQIEHRLTRWKQLYLSNEGRTTLIKSTLSNLATSCLCFSSQLTLPSKLRSYNEISCGEVWVKRFT